MAEMTVDLKSLEGVQGHLEQSAAEMAGEGMSSRDVKTVNEYLERMQRPDLTAADIVSATRDFLKSDLAGRCERDFEEHGDIGKLGGYKRLLDDMKSTAKAFADEWGVDSRPVPASQAAGLHGDNRNGPARKGAVDESVVQGADPMVSPQGQRYNHLDSGQIQTSLQTKTWQPL